MIANLLRALVKVDVVDVGRPNGCREEDATVRPEQAPEFHEDRERILHVLEELTTDDAVEALVALVPKEVDLFEARATREIVKREHALRERDRGRRKIE